MRYRQHRTFIVLALVILLQMSTQTTKEAYQKGLELLRSVSSRRGFYASNEETRNYKRVWGRDSVIAGLASLVSGEKELIDTFTESLRTLRDHQDETGRMPSNVDIEDGHVSYGTTVGRIDATLWYIIGVCQLLLHTGRRELMNDFKKSLEKALFYLSCLELNGRGFVYIPQGGDWADEYINHGYVLYDELLYLIALESYAKVSEDKDTAKKAERLRNMIRVNYFPRAEDLESEYIYHRAFFEHSLKEYKPPLPIAYFSNHSIRYHTDNLANALFMHIKICGGEENKEIVERLSNDFLHGAHPLVPAFSPVIHEGDEHWEHLKVNFLYGFKNKPYEYHNGGLWPMVHGFFLASIKDEHLSEEYLSAFAEFLKKDDYIFPEYYNGRTHEWGGIPRHSFSASGYILAHQAIAKDKHIFL